MNRIAYDMGRRNPQARGEMRLYKLIPPYEFDVSWDDTKEMICVEFVIVSATVVDYSGPETYIFQADQDGKILRWGELTGSYRGGLDHEAALNGMGYQVVPLEELVEA
jgi:hypothetical protein